VATADQSGARARGPWTCAAVVFLAAAKAALEVGLIRVATRISDPSPFVVRDLADRHALQHPSGIHDRDPQSLVPVRALCPRCATARSRCQERHNGPTTPRHRAGSSGSQSRPFSAIHRVEQRCLSKRVADTRHKQARARSVSGSEPLTCGVTGGRYWV
jgi:hypothetical protein